MAYILSLFNHKLNSTFTHDHSTFSFEPLKQTNYYGFTEKLWNEKSLDLFDLILKHYIYEYEDNLFRTMKIKTICEKLTCVSNNSNSYHRGRNVISHILKECKHTKLFMLQQRNFLLQTPLHSILAHGDDYLTNIDFYLQNSDLNVQDELKNTPLHTYMIICSRYQGYCSLSIIYKCFLHGSNLFIENSEQMTPKDLCPRSSNEYFLLEQLEKLQLLQEFWNLDLFVYTNGIQWLPKELLEDMLNFFLESQQIFLFIYLEKSMKL